MADPESVLNCWGSAFSWDRRCSTGAKPTPEACDGRSVVSFYAARESVSEASWIGMQARQRLELDFGLAFLRRVAAYRKAGCDAPGAGGSGRVLTKTG